MLVKLRTMLKNILVATFILSHSVAIQAEEPPEKNKVLWNPSAGDTWTYKITLEVAKDTTIPSDIEGQVIEELEGKIRTTYLQTAVYHGLLPISEDGPKAHAFYFSNGKQLEEIQYMLIEGNMVKAMASKQEGKKPRKLISLSIPIPLVDVSWKGGESFPVMMDQVVEDKQIRMSRMFRAIGWEQVETDAGDFKALHVQVTGMNGGLELKRSYWFVPGVGFIKEDKKYYLADKMILRQVRELTETSKAKVEQVDQ